MRDEYGNGVHGRFQQSFGSVLGQVLKAQSILDRLDVRFADFKCAGIIDFFPCIPGFLTLFQKKQPFRHQLTLWPGISGFIL